MAKHILLLNGPNLNLLGTREPSVYGSETLADVETRLVASADAMGAQVTCIQSNAEHELVDAVHQARLLQALLKLRFGIYIGHSYFLTLGILRMRVAILYHIYHTRRSLRYFFSLLISAISIGLSSRSIIIFESFIKKCGEGKIL